jgi:hypothetical protein
MLAAFLAGDGVLVLLMPEQQTRLWSPEWSPPPWRRFLRFLSTHTSLARGLAVAELSAGIGLAVMSHVPYAVADEEKEAD